MLLLGLFGTATVAEAQPSTPTINQSSKSAGSGIAAGTISLGGGIGYNSSTDKSSSNNGTNSTNTKSSQFNFRPTVGYFIAENLELGLELGYASNRRSVSSTPGPVVAQPQLKPATNLNVGPYVRYYKMLSDQFGVTGALGGGFQNSRSYGYDYTGANTLEVLEYKGDGFYANLTPAIVFFPIPKFAMSASLGSLGYSRVSYDFPKGSSNPAPSNYENTSSGFGANFGLNQLAFGGTYYFGQ
ncbi:hypothetical protein SAMN04515668_1848 [Hymenobacter arizonensis]|uniref:Outer membrane protein beta-barrel domain-containing protein n=2 Tax=Hymenobacter arizonensis TaxID=1227077 RepID=A0A1I5XH88_HYMAR|nr:hypothetical protein SAMN04515668_1848 [Hymenobacter arizonensis]